MPAPRTPRNHRAGCGPDSTGDRRNRLRLRDNGPDVGRCGTPSVGENASAAETTRASDLRRTNLADY
jgi:hypothetical protein